MASMASKYSGPKLGDGWMIHSIGYVEGVRTALKDKSLWVSEEWFSGQYERIMLHREMGFLPAQSAEELRPFAEVKLRPHYDSQADLRFMMQRSRELASQRKDGES